MAVKEKPVSRMSLEEVKAALENLRARLDRGEITREQFIAMREPLGARLRAVF